MLSRILMQSKSSQSWYMIEDLESKVLLLPDVFPVLGPELHCTHICQHAQNTGMDDSYVHPAGHPHGMAYHCREDHRPHTVHTRGKNWII